MNKYLLIFFALFPLLNWAQFGNNQSSPLSYSTSCDLTNLKEFTCNPDTTLIQKAIENTDLYCVALGVDQSLGWKDFTLTGITPQGDKIYQLKIKAPKAQALSIQFEKLTLSKGAKLWIFNEYNQFVGMYSSQDIYNPNHFITSFLEGESFTIEYIEPKNVQTQELTISKAYYAFRGFKSTTGFGNASSCMLNAFCSEGNSYRGSVNATCKIIVYGGGSTYLCSGSLINNTREDGTPYILTANHCSKNSVLSDLVDWEFLFYYQSAGCFNPSSSPSVPSYKGCTAVAYTGSDNGEYSSDFLLVKLIKPLPVNLIDFTFIGWDRSSLANGGGVCFHHPQGDIKKVSTYYNTPVISGYRANGLTTHYKVNWSQTANGISVTEGGSSGSGLLNSAGRLIGTLTGGGSACGGNLVYEPDYYGRMYYHWDKNFNSSTNPQTRLKDWLDPINSNQTFVKTSLASTLGIHAPSSSPQYKIQYSNDRLILTSLQSKYTARIYNMLGQEVFNQYSNDPTLEINISDWQKGIYIIEIDQFDQRYVEKFINK